MHTLCFSTKQGETLIASLICHIRRMNRDLEHKKKKAEELQMSGDSEHAAKIIEGFYGRIERIETARRMVEIVKRSMEEE